MAAKDDIITSKLAKTFNTVLYKIKLEHNPTLQLDQNIVACYLAEGIPAQLLSTTHFARAIFASFCRKHMDDSSRLPDILASGQQMYLNNINVDPLVAHCLTNMGLYSPVYCAVPEKQRPVRDRLHDLEPNNAAIMASRIYHDLFHSKTLLRYADQSCDRRDLQALVFIDYLVRTPDVPGVNDILDSEGSLESRALRIGRHILEQNDSLFMRDYEDTAPEIEEHTASLYTRPRGMRGLIRSYGAAVMLALGAAGWLGYAAYRTECSQGAKVSDTAVASCHKDKR